MARIDALKWPHLGHMYSIHQDIINNQEIDHTRRTKYSRASSQYSGLTRPLCAKHFRQMRAYRLAAGVILGSSSPSNASASLSYHCFRGGVTGVAGAEMVSTISIAKRTLIGKLSYTFRT